MKEKMTIWFDVIIPGADKLLARLTEQLTSSWLYRRCIAKALMPLKCHWHLGRPGSAAIRNTRQFHSDMTTFYELALYGTYSHNLNTWNYHHKKGIQNMWNGWHDFHSHKKAFLLSMSSMKVYQVSENYRRQERSTNVYKYVQISCVLNKIL